MSTLFKHPLRENLTGNREGVPTLLTKLAQSAPVTINIYDIKGQLLRTLHIGNKGAGIYVTKDRAAYWDGMDTLGEKVGSGIYFYTLKAGDFSATRKMLIVK